MAIEAMVVKPTIKTLEKIRIYASNQLELLDVDHQIYVPNRFLFGNFKDRMGGLILNSDDIKYSEEPKDLQRYQGLIDSKEFEIVSRLQLEEKDLGFIAEHGAQYNIEEGKLRSIAEYITKQLNNSE